MAAPTYSWNVIAASQCDADSPLDEVLMEALRQNQIHLEEWLGDGYTAAKNHDHDGSNSKIPIIGAGTVAQSSLLATTGEVSANSVGGWRNLTLPGGQCGFYPQLKMSVTGPYNWGANLLNYQAHTGWTSYATSISLYADSTLYYVSALQRYIQASPPYNLGNGDIPLFMFIMLDSLGDIKATYIAEDPPWANNGPTNIRPDFYRDGKAYQIKRQIPKLETVINNNTKLTSYLANLDKMPIVEVEISHAIKNADMPLIPHPFIGNDLKDKTIIMIDPVGSMCEKLHQMALAGESINEILHKGYLKLDNTPLAVNAPLGVMAVKANWK